MPGEFDMRRPSWQERAACRGMGPQLFYPEKGNPADAWEAKELCRTCPVRPDCLEYALDTGDRHGIWGGTTEKPRMRMRGERIRAGAAARIIGKADRSTRAGKALTPTAIRKRAERRRVQETEAVLGTPIRAVMPAVREGAG